MLELGMLMSITCKCTHLLGLDISVVTVQDLYTYGWRLSECVLVHVYCTHWMHVYINKVACAAVFKLGHTCNIQVPLVGNSEVFCTFDLRACSNLQVYIISFSLLQFFCLILLWGNLHIWFWEGPLRMIRRQPTLQFFTHFSCLILVQFYWA